MDDMRAYGKKRREEAVSMAMKRKEEYLGARVSKELRGRVIEQAKKAGMPVSILIRNTLEEAFRESSEDEGMLSSTPSTNEKNMESERFGAVIGWESIQLNKAIECSGCGVVLQKGAKASIGVGSQQTVVICAACKEDT